MSDMTRTQQQALIECLRALDGGTTLEACLARFPEAATLGPYLALRDRLLTMEVPLAPAAAYASGRQALLEQLARPSTASPYGLTSRLRDAFANSWQSRLVRAAAAAVIVFALVGGGLGASAAAGVDRANDVLSALHLVAPASNEQSPSPTPGAATPSNNGGQKNVPGAAEEREHPTDASPSGSGHDSNGEEHRPCDSKDATPSAQEVLLPCTPAENEGPAARIPSPNDERPSDGATPTEHQETPHTPSGETDQGEGSHPADSPNVTPGPVDDGAEGESRGRAPERPAPSFSTDDHANP